MKRMHFIITLATCSVLTAALPQTNFPSLAQSEDRIVNTPPRRPPAANVDILIREELRPGISNQRRPQGGIRPQEVDTLFPASSQRPFPVNGDFLPPTPPPGNCTRNSGSHENERPPQPELGHDSRPVHRESSCGVFPNPGECQAAFPRYYYNKTTSQCDCYLFGGCDEGIGSYRTLDECHHKCLPDIKHEGPNCKFVYIDNFSPLTPSTESRPPTASTSTQAPQRHPDSVTARPGSDRQRPGRPGGVNPLNAQGASIFDSDVIPPRPQTATTISDNNIPARGPILPQRIPQGPIPFTHIPLPGGFPLGVPQGGMFVAMSSSSFGQSRFPDDSDERERVFG